MEEKDTKARTPQVNPGYPLFQIAKAFTTSEQHEDPATRERAEQKISEWVTVFNGIVSGTLDVGSRTPLKGVPGWATLEVVTGGFATGELLAGGPLLEHERALLARFPAVSEAGGRQVLNGYYLTDDGLAELQERLRSGCYDVRVPEEGALLVVAWLVQNRYVEEARELLDELAPHFPKLRFYPIPVERPRRFGARVFVQDVGTTIDQLRSMKPNHRILAQKEAIQIWNQLYDRTVGLFLETVDGETPSLRRRSEGERVSTPGRRFPVEGGWPCQAYPEGWRSRAQAVLEEYDRARAQHQLCGKPERAKENFPQLRTYLRRIILDPGSLNGRDVGKIRLILASYVTKRGTPDSPRCRELREKQVRQASVPTFHEISRAVVPRLESHPRDGGVDDLSAITRPITPEEGRPWSIEGGTPIPPSIERKIERCLRETVEVLVERGIVTSGETLARVLPQMTSGLRAAGIRDPNLRQLYAANYGAFRRRRSLLLLNLESQIKIEELPWVAAMDRFRTENLSTQELAKQTLQEVTVLTVVSFPHAIIPNKLVQELWAFASGTDLNLPLVDEIAADIFMGEFSGKFLQAAKRAATLLEGTLYEKYYGIDYRKLRQIPELRRGKKSWYGRGTPDLFGQLCSCRAGVSSGEWDPAVNGMIIEQQQILTSQNLAVLFEGLDLVETLRDSLDDLARRCFAWICRRQQVKSHDWHASLIMLKNTAYAWRQMIFYLSLLPNAQVQTFLTWAEHHLNSQRDEFQSRFRPALRGLCLAAEGRSPDDDAARRQGARRFLGWTTERHWLLG